ncbi:MAG: type II toxin-antitoxin system death-on-curing family toxin [Pseudomonadota bacterium]
MARDEPVWVALSTALAVHDALLAEHGGHAGLGDAARLESTLARPRNSYGDGERSLPTLAASLAFGIAQDHPFVDGNKRTSLVVAELFLELNDLELVASDEKCILTFLALAAGEHTEAQLASWFIERTR